jgi:hypothetical protein
VCHLALVGAAAYAASRVLPPMLPKQIEPLDVTVLTALLAGVVVTAWF